VFASGGGGNYIPGAAGAEIVETTLTRAMQEEGMLGPPLPKDGNLEYDERAK